MSPTRHAAFVVAGVLAVAIGAGFALQAAATPEPRPAPSATSQQPCQANVMVGRPSLDPSLDKPSGPSCEGGEKHTPKAKTTKNTRHHRRHCGSKGMWVGFVVVWFSLGVPALLMLIARDHRRRRRAAKRAAQQDPNGQPPFEM